MHVIPRFAQEPLAGYGIRSLLKSDANRWEDRTMACGECHVSDRNAQD